MLVELLLPLGIQVVGVTKAVLGSPEIARAMLAAGAVGLGDSRIENIETMRRAGVRDTLSLIRSPMITQIDRVVASADISFNTELDVIRKLSTAARLRGRVHRVVLMVELGDLREGIMPDDLESVVRETLRLPNIMLEGIGANLACRSGVAPDDANMAELGALVESIERTFGLALRVVSGGNSASLTWALGGADTSRVNQLRLGESVLLGCEPLQRQPIPGLYTDVVTLVAEVIESKAKPSRPWGEVGESAFGIATPAVDRGQLVQTILALGHQDTDPEGLRPPAGVELLGASGDHLVVANHRRLVAGTELRFQPNYSALVRAMTSPFVAKVLKAESVSMQTRCGVSAAQQPETVISPCKSSA
jgi:predicted amino acid racemase